MYKMSSAEIELVNMMLGNYKTIIALKKEEVEKMTKEDIEKVRIALKDIVSLWTSFLQNPEACGAAFLDAMIKPEGPIRKTPEQIEYESEHKPIDFLAFKKRKQEYRD